MKTELRRARWPSLILQPHTWTLGIVFFIDVFVSMNIGRGRKRIWFWHLRLAVDENWHPPILWRFLTAFISARHLSYINPIHVFSPHFFKMHFSTVTPSMPRSSNLSRSLESLHKNFMHLSCFPHVPHAPARLFLLDLITRTTFGEPRATNSAQWSWHYSQNTHIDSSANVTTPCSGAEEGSPPINATHDDVLIFFYSKM